MTESSSIDWQDYHHSELTVQQLYAILALRSEVFVVEQTCAYQDIDGQDLTGENRHIVAWLDGKPAAYARILRHEDGVAIGRVIVAPSARGLKLGYQLMERALVSCQKNWPDIRVAISAQAHLEGFYGKLGFAVYTGVYEEDGIPHVGMELIV
ncbi:GNAT family N-acetyltransferase [Rahnella inusitata]|jgi:ElaA protein|uniref:GNAT family N-acetyltransferase n=1 Tax=Rahnella inusitata TaxID=58169 RepID=A0ABX9P6E9_9GAMM|nr:GNAT family N-acetyltransferase [Rahnella inusitata]NMC24268.1 GNAT family N-acetyltransferase [Serratia sp. (in: enterobacteria)]RJT15139.1 GNAT family N-acetyltransferase [Rahnella inusitata]